MSDTSVVEKAWALYRSAVLEDMEDPASIEAAELIFLAGFRSALMTFAVLSKPEYSFVRSSMLLQAAAECDRRLGVSQ